MPNDLSATSDPIPDNSSRLAFVIGRIFHPYIVCIPTVLVVLNDLTLNEALFWSGLVLALLLVPLIGAAVIQGRKGHEIYQRRTRGPLYFAAWLGVVAGIIALLVLNGPHTLLACLLSLSVWLPAQLAINTYVTKVSTHAAVVSGCSTGLFLLGKLNSPALLMLVLVIIPLTMWARVRTRNHTVPQVIMGGLVGALAVLLVFPLAL